MVKEMESNQIPILDLNKVLSGGLMQGLGAASEQSIVSVVLPAPGIVLLNHIYIPILPPLPLLPEIIVP